MNLPACRRRPKGFSGQVSFCDLSNDGAATENQRTIADGRHFDEIGRDGDDREASIERFEEQAVDFAPRADVYAGGGVLEDEKLAFEVEPSAQHNFLMVAVGQVFDQRLLVIPAELEESAQSARRPTLSCGMDRRQDHLVLDARIEEQVLGDGKTLHDRVRAAVAAGEAQTIDSVGLLIVTSFPFRRQFPAVKGTNPKMARPRSPVRPPLSGQTEHFSGLD